MRELKGMRLRCRLRKVGKERRRGIWGELVLRM
jgi:hypothetical protein